MSIGRKGARHSPLDSAAVPTDDEHACLVRVVSDGDAECAPAGTTPADAVRLTAEADDPAALALLLYPAAPASAVRELAEAWDLHPILVEDLLHGGQRPKLERYGDALFLVVRSAHYDDEREEVDFAEFHVLVRPGAIAILCQDGVWCDGTPGSALVDADSEAGERAIAALLGDELPSPGPEAVAYRLLDAIVDGYAPVLQGLGVDKDEIEKQVFDAEPSVAERIYRLSREVIDLQHATTGLVEVLRDLRAGFVAHDVPEDLQTYLQDVSDHLDRIGTRAAEYREALTQILNVNATLVAQRQNEDMKKISGWAAILFAPTLFAAIYGMNFQHMPELDWAYGYPLSIAVMVGFSVGLYRVFKAKKWM